MQYAKSVLMSALCYSNVCQSVRPTDNLSVTAADCEKLYSRPTNINTVLHLEGLFLEQMINTERE
jgi:hypothetical protein